MSDVENNYIYMPNSTKSRIRHYLLFEQDMSREDAKKFERSFNRVQRIINRCDDFDLCLFDD